VANATTDDKGTAVTPLLSETLLDGDSRVGELVDTASSAQQANSTSARPMHSSDVSSNVIAPTATSPQVAPSSPGISTSFSTSLPSQNLHGDASGDGGGDGQHIDWAIN